MPDLTTKRSRSKFSLLLQAHTPPYIAAGVIGLGIALWLTSKGVPGAAALALMVAVWIPALLLPYTHAWMGDQSPTRQPGAAPHGAGRVRFDEFIGLLGTLGAATMFPTGWAVGYPAAAAVGVLIPCTAVYAIGGRHWNWHPTATVVGTTRRALWLAENGRIAGGVAAGMLAAATTTALGVPGGVLGGLVVTAVVALRGVLKDARTHGQTFARTRRAANKWPEMPPAQVDINRDGDVTGVVVQLPEKHGAGTKDNDTEDLQSRASELPGLTVADINFNYTDRWVRITPLSLPTFVEYPGSAGQPWNQIPLGVTSDGSTIVWDVLVSPHALLCGVTGSGKSVIERNILFHALQHEEWRIVGIDLKRVEMSWLRKYPAKVLKVATELEDAVELLRSLKMEMERRYQEMEENGVNNFRDLKDPPKPILIMIDEAFVLFSMENVKSDEGKERDAMHAEARTVVAELARLARASGMFICVATQRPDASVLGGELKLNLDFRIAAGRLDSTPSSMVLDSDAATTLPKIKGRGAIREGGDTTVFQGFFAEQTWIDEWLATQPDATPPAEPVGDDEADALGGPAPVDMTKPGPVTSPSEPEPEQGDDQPVDVGSRGWLNQFAP